MNPKENGRRRRLFWTLQIAGWTLFGLAMLAAGLSQWKPREAVVTKASLTIFGFAASLLLRTIYRFLARRGASLPAAVAAGVPLSFFAAGLWMGAHHAALGRAIASPGAARLPAAGPDFTNTIYYFFVLLVWSALYFGVPAYLDLVEHRERLRRAEASAHAARLQALRFQLNPHLLFNTLNAISTLVADGRSGEANRMISRLADFLRATLDAPSRAEIPLADEVEFARRYLEIEETRFGDRLRVEIAVDGAAADGLVPPMILQPLVENAVRHAIHSRESGGSIAISARRRDGTLSLEVEDDGPGLDAAAGTRPGVGLSNTRRRLAELYGAGAELRLGRSPRGGLSVSIRLPWRVAPAEA